MKNTTRGRGVMAALVLTAVTAACTTTAEPPAKRALEKTTIKVGVVASADAAPLFIAQRKGYFAQEGLTVEPVVLQGAAVAAPEVLKGGLDLGQTDYVVNFLASSRGMDMKIVGNLYRAGQDTFALMVEADSPIRSLADLKGKEIAVNTLNSLGTLILEDSGLKTRDVRLIEMPYPDMEARLTGREIDAALVAEPFVTMGEQHGSVRELAGTVSSRIKDLPVGGWMAAGGWSRTNPGTLAAFQRAIEKAQRVAASDRKEVEAVLPTYLKIDAGTAAKTSLGAYPAGPDPQGLQRVADIVHEHGYVDAPVDIRSLTG
ncbi:ABC transporter substrate-binding protein [Nonomuraea sp. LPB2021202275-12-8]|uniref:ABC transporter substrate-binding protein n=1 Tax=Nonomuraea sp. LPB2021202275-12-8 TaxID=3120159 RepID=UPI00300D5E6A